MMRRAVALVAAFNLAACSREAKLEEALPVEGVQQCDISLLVLGVAQDAGKPQIGNPGDPAWTDLSLTRHATSLALIDRRGALPKRWLFEATPDIKQQLHALNIIEPHEKPVQLDGIFLTHAHIGHYAGLMMLGHEAAGAQNVPVYAMPRMADYLSANGPWSQLVKYYNITLAIMNAGEAELLTDGISVTPILVPHRQEFSEVVGYIIESPDKSALFIPDIDSWEEWDDQGMRIEEMIARVDLAYLDASFFADGEIPGRDMSGFPHPFVSHSMARFAELPQVEKEKVRFIHMNNTNPLHDPGSSERVTVRDAGFNIAEEGEEICLTAN